MGSSSPQPSMSVCIYLHCRHLGRFHLPSRWSSQKSRTLRNMGEREMMSSLVKLYSWFQLRMGDVHSVRRTPRRFRLGTSYSVAAELKSVAAAWPNGCGSSNGSAGGHGCRTTGAVPSSRWRTSLTLTRRRTREFEAGERRVVSVAGGVDGAAWRQRSASRSAGSTSIPSLLPLLRVAPLTLQEAPASAAPTTATRDLARLPQIGQESANLLTSDTRTGALQVSPAEFSPLSANGRTQGQSVIAQSVAAKRVHRSATIGLSRTGRRRAWPSAC